MTAIFLRRHALSSPSPRCSWSFGWPLGIMQLGMVVRDGPPHLLFFLAPPIGSSVLVAFAAGLDLRARFSPRPG